MIGEKRYDINGTPHISGVHTNLAKSELLYDLSEVVIKRKIGRNQAYNNPELINRIGEYENIIKQVKIGAKKDDWLPAEIDERLWWNGGIQEWVDYSDETLKDKQ